MRKLIVVVVVLGALATADVAARAWAESKLAEQAAAYYPPGTRASAAIRSFPFLGRLLLDGEVPEVRVGMENLQADVVTIRHLGLRLSDVIVDRDGLFRGRVEVTDVGAGRVEAFIDGPSLARATGLDLRFRDGEVEFHRTIGGVDVFARARVTLEGNRLRVVPTSVQGADVPPASFTVTYDIPGVELLPCTAQVRPVLDGLMVACGVEDVPPALVRGVQNASVPAPPR